jgi:ribose transport system substrate-binding protein
MTHHISCLRYLAGSEDVPITAAMIMGTLGNSTSESRLDGLVSGVVFERSNQFGLGL